MPKQHKCTSMVKTNNKTRRCKRKATKNGQCSQHHNLLSHKCYLCNEECNPCSQTCGRCARMIFLKY